MLLMVRIFMLTALIVLLLGRCFILLRMEVLSRLLSLSLLLLLLLLLLGSGAWSPDRRSSNAELLGPLTIGLHFREYLLMRS